MPDASSSQSQPTTRSCGVMIEFHRLLESDPGYRGRLVKIEQNTQKRIARMNVAKLSPLTIPVVVHVLFNNDADNIGDDQIASQIAVLNADYGGTNADVANVPDVWKSLVGKARLTFKLAKVDPDGKATNGIVRVATEVEEFGADDMVKSSATGGSDAWDRDRYLNMWVCNLGGGLLGYAQFPGGPAETDGVVIRTSASAPQGTVADPFDLGRTATHEVGHFFNLRHIWGDTEDCSGSDLVADTPRQKLPNNGKPAFPRCRAKTGPMATCS